MCVPGGSLLYGLFQPDFFIVFPAVGVGALLPQVQYPLEKRDTAGFFFVVLRLERSDMDSRHAVFNVFELFLRDPDFKNKACVYQKVEPVFIPCRLARAPILL